MKIVKDDYALLRKFVKNEGLDSVSGSPSVPCKFFETEQLKEMKKYGKGDMAAAFVFIRGRDHSGPRSRAICAVKTKISRPENSIGTQNRTVDTNSASL